jgi:hypothetical protein
MTRSLRVTLVVATVLSGLLGACGSDTTTDATAATSTVAPSASQPSTSAAPPTPGELVDRWVGPPRPVGALGTGTSAAFVVISDGFLEYETGIAENPKAFSSDLTAGTDGTIEVTLAGDVLDCVVGDVGQYEWSLSPQATTLTLTAVDDACAARQAALEGAWTHTACKQPGRDCLGIVEAGTYSTNRFNPYGGFTYGEATFTLPDGWAVIHDTQASLFLGSADDYTGPDPAPWGLTAWADVAAASPDSDDCGRGPTDQPDPTVGAGAENIAAWMAALPTLSATRSTMTISGMPAQVVDAEVADGATICDWGIVLIVSRTSKPDPFNYGIVEGQHMRIILFDVAPERTVAIFVDDTGHPGFEDLEKVAMPIVESFVFSPTPPTG